MKCLEQCPTHGVIRVRIIGSFKQDPVILTLIGLNDTLKNKTLKLHINVRNVMCNTLNLTNIRRLLRGQCF